MGAPRDQLRASAFALGLSLAAGGAAAQTSQAWTEVDFLASWRRVGLEVPLVARLDADQPNPQFLGTGLTADLHLPWRLTLTGGYLFVNLPQRAQSEVDVPLAALSTAFRLGRVTLADRNRFEKLVGLGTSPVRYRNRLLANLPLGPRDRWHAFVSDEVFYDFSASHWTQNRFQAGGGTRLSPRLSVDLYFLQRDVRGPAPATRVVGATARITLTGTGKGGA